jgi:LDH2 family malate/lactate/ureidoglycolate dehydrogenase
LGAQTIRAIAPRTLRSIATRIFDRLGSPHEESSWVAETLVNSSLRGYDSHGILRIAQYAAYLQEAVVVPGARFEILKNTRSVALVDGHQGWGQVVARKAMQLAIEKAKRSSIGTVVVRNSQHVSRLGEYPAMAVAHGMIGLSVINIFGGVEVEKVAPWGGIDPKLAPNPIAWAAPSGEKWPMVLDMTTSVVPEGKVRLARYQKRQLPEGCILDASGNPTTSPDDFYGPPQGALLPLGGIAGNKGYGLAILADLLGGALSGSGLAGQKKSPSGNGLFFQAINIADFVPMKDFLRDVRDLTAWIKSSRRRPGIKNIYMPGEGGYRTLEKRKREGIPVDESIWEELLTIAKGLKIKI